MAKTKNKKSNFRDLLRKYLDIKGLDIIIVTEDGREIELNKNRLLVDDEIVTFDKKNEEKRIPLSQIRSVDMYAA
ncbi:MAG: hypothetical protein MUD12_05900 [Spirochaetes bacterium]|jgi:hypothetical protein|nr:hypothetical protein [Spirochaetota bacterium]